MVESCALSGSDLKIKFRTILLTSIAKRVQRIVTYGPYFKKFKKIGAWVNSKMPGRNAIDPYSSRGFGQQ